MDVLKKFFGKITIVIWKFLFYIKILDFISYARRAAKAVGSASAYALYHSSPRDRVLGLLYIDRAKIAARAS